MIGIVHIVDDDPALRKALKNLFTLENINVELYEDALHFIDRFEVTYEPGCLVLDLRMPGLSGRELQDKLNDKCTHWPIIFLTGHGKVHTAVEAMKRGAIEFLEKPVDNDVLITAVKRALEQSQKLTYRAEARSKLTDREKEVLDHMEYGETIKGIALKLSISEKTVEFHRSNLSNKINLKEYKSARICCPPSFSS